MLAHSNSILSSVILISEKLKGSKLEDSVLNDIDESLNLLSSFLNLEKIESLFFALFFSLNNQENRSITLHTIAEYLDYPFLHLLEYRYVIVALENKSFITGNNHRNVSSRPENNGYVVPETVSNSVIDGKEIIFPRKEEKTLEDVISEIVFIAKAYKENVMGDIEYTRQIMWFECNNQHIDLIKNVTKMYPEDFDHRILIYFFSFSLIFGEEPAEPIYLRNGYETSAFDCLSISSKEKRRRDFFSGTDCLIKREILEKKRDDNIPRYGTVFSFRFTNKGIKKLFGNESKRFYGNDKATELDIVISGIQEIAFNYEDKCTRKRKKQVLKQIENKFQKYSYFKLLRKLVHDDISRFIYFDCIKDFINGHESGLGATLQNIYGRKSDYFTTLRSFIDEKHFLIESGLIEINQNEIIENTTITLTDKSVEILYGENADLYKRNRSLKNILNPEDLKSKDLFYEVNTQNQIEMLTGSLIQDNLINIQKRLEEKGLPKGVAVLLYGAPGTGKTETVYQIARKTNRKIMHVDISESKSMWFGESEKCIKKIFSNYRSLCKSCQNHNENAPILLFNEADAIISKRGSLEGGGPRQTENAMQNILLEEIEKLDGILIATTNLCENMDAAFERRFLFKIKYEKPSIESRSKIWINKLNSISSEDAFALAKQFDFSGGEIDNIVRKGEMDEIITGIQPTYDRLVELCENERLEKANEKRMGFAC